MAFNWNEFKDKYQNEQEARQAFVILCDLLMTRKYPEFIIKNSDNIKEEDNKKDHSLNKKCKVFLAKYFLDGVSNSRKGQIRKSLNDNLPYMKANKITEWYLLLPLTFSNDESNWWETWSLRIKQEYGITPTVILSDKIVDMIADLDEKYKGTEKIERRKKFSDTAITASTTEDSDETLAFVTEGDNNNEEPSNTKSDNIITSILEAVEEATSDNIQLLEIPNESNNENSNPEAKSVATNENTETTVATTAVATATETSATETSTAETTETTTSHVTSHGKRLLANSNNQEEEEEEDSQNKSVVAEPTLNQLKNTWNFKQKFEALETEKLALPTDKDNNQRAVFDKRREESNVKNYLNDFVFGDLSNYKGKELVRKGQIYVTNHQYSRGLYMYEYANAKGLIDDEATKADYIKGVDEACFKLTYKYNMISGDLHFAKRNYINAAESYKKAMDCISDYEDDLGSTTTQADMYSSLIRDDEAETKYLEAKAESLLQVGEFSESIKNFQSALDLSPENENIKKRMKLAKYLENGTCPFKNKVINALFGWVKIFSAPYYYWRAKKIDPNLRELKNYKKLRNRAIWGLLLLLIILAAIFGLYYWIFMSQQPDTDDEIVDDNRTQASVATTPLEMYLNNGRYYERRISEHNPHYIDSALYAYERALRYDNTDTAAENGRIRVLEQKSYYIAIVQKNINNDSATYFLSMRSPTEGLRLFKYKYEPREPELGKFGFVDENMNVVIPPVYDFNYKKMNENGETFYNGKAKVCLKVAEADTVYFWIDKFGNRIDNIDEDGNPIQ